MITSDTDIAIKRIVRNTSEIITLSELKDIVNSRSGEVRGYIGFEPSGMFHIGWIIWAMKLQDLIDVGFKMVLLEATWHAWINDKLGGDMEAIKRCSKYVEHCLRALGVDVDKLTIIDAEDVVSDSEYWRLVLKIAKSSTLSRVKRALTIMGRREEEGVMDFSKLIYPVMQVADIFYLNVDIALGGMDQRKAHVLARDVAEKLHFKKPIAIHIPLLTGLQGSSRMDYLGEQPLIEAKMSKSKPETAIFVHDGPEEIRAKILKAFCPPKVVDGNPIMEINKYILFSREDFNLTINRPEKYGGTLLVNSYHELEKLYSTGKIHPLDLKNSTAEALIKYLSPIRKYFTENPEARRLLEELRGTRITR